MPEKINNNHLEKIDVLRGVAILFVFLYHCQLVFYPNLHQDIYLNGFLQLNSLKDFIIKFNPLAYGYTGVHLFLIISGFVIHLSYLRSGKQFKLIKFFKRRFWRIYPPYLIVVLFICFTRIGFGYYLFSPEGKQTLLYHFLLIHNFSSADFFLINASFWSLALEVQLYLIYPIFLMFRKMVGISKAFLIVLFIGILLSIPVYIFPNLITNNVYTTFVLKFWFLWCAGALLAENYTIKKRFFNNSNLLLIIAALLVLIFSKLIQILLPLIYFFSAVFWVLIFESFLHSVKFINDKIIYKFLKILGIFSYSLYLIHQPYLAQLINYFAVFTKTGHLRFLNIIPAGIILFMIAYSMYNTIEKFFIKVSKRL